MLTSFEVLVFKGIHKLFVALDRSLWLLMEIQDGISYKYLYFSFGYRDAMLVASLYHRVCYAFQIL